MVPGTRLVHVAEIRPVQGVLAVRLEWASRDGFGLLRERGASLDEGSGR